MIPFARCLRYLLGRRDFFLLSGGMGNIMGMKKFFLRAIKRRPRAFLI